MAIPEMDTLRALRKDGKLVPFVGAGLSVPLGLPSFSKLIDIIAEKLNYDPDVFKLNGNDLQLAEYYVASKGSIGPLRSEMDKLFYPSDEEIRASRAHTALAEMKLPLIYTTNYDIIIERAFQLNNIPCVTIAKIDDMASAPSDATTQIVKFHGTFEDDATLVLTESNYFDRLEFESALDIKLRADILGKTLLFIGYSLTDINIRYMMYKLHKLRQQVKRESRLVPSAYLTTFNSGEIQKTLLARWNVAIIELDPVNKNESVNQFLEELSKEDVK